MFSFLFKQMGVKTPLQKMTKKIYALYIAVILVSVVFAGLLVYSSDTLSQFITMHGTTALHLRLWSFTPVVYRLLAGLTVLLALSLVGVSFKLPLAEMRMIGTRLENYRPEVKRVVRFVGITGSLIFILLVILTMLY